jgi:hypothetical protein
MRKRAIIDIDNTLWHFCDAFYEELQKINENFPAPDRWAHWDMWEGYCSLEDFLGAVNAVHFNQNRDRYLPYPEAKYFLSTLKENGYHITIASHRSPDYKRQTKVWLEKHALAYDELHLSFHKTLLFDRFTDVVVDDSPQVLEKAVESGVGAAGLLFPWNRDYAGNGFMLFSNLSEILYHILNGTLSRPPRKKTNKSSEKYRD